jgi:formyltetrahydrofolate synthetase
VKKIFDLASELGLSEEDILPYGWYIGKLEGFK